MKKKSWFTLLEMVIVMGLLAFLMTIIFPALVRGREMAKKSYCLNNISQTVKFAQMYNLDYGGTPYSSTWLVDFSFLAKYLDQPKYGIMECPETDDSVKGSAELNGGTSYHYMGSRYDWENNNRENGDGSEYGFDAQNPSILNILSAKQEKLIYDKSDTVHYGTFNMVRVDSGSAESYTWSDRVKFWFMTQAGNLNFKDIDTPNRTHNLNEYRYEGKFVMRGEGFQEEPQPEPENPNPDNPNPNPNPDNPNPEPPTPQPKPWKVRIIHYPPGNPRNSQEICVGYAAWAAHQAHGDELLEILYK